MIAAEVGLWLQQRDVEALDPALLLHAAVQPMRLVERLDRALLETSDRRLQVMNRIRSAIPTSFAHDPARLPGPSSRPSHRAGAGAS